MENEKRLIDANALFEAVSGIGKDIKRPRAVELACLCLIAEAPTVDAVEVVHGRWIEAEDGDGLVCSVCREDFCNIYLEVERFNYCPNCGAKMINIEELK